MARVYAVASAKGGVGKTTTTANVGVALAAAGHLVAVVDADVGMPNLGRLLDLAPEGPTLHDVLAGDAAPLDAVYEGPEGVAVVPGDTALDAYSKASPQRLRTVVDALSGYDVVLIDTGAGLSHETLLPLSLADAVLLVSTPSPDALGDTEKTRQLTERVGVPVAGLVLTRVDAERDDVDALSAAINVPLVEVVPEDSLVAESTIDLSVTENPATAVGSAYRSVAETVVAATGARFDTPVAVADDSSASDADDDTDDDADDNMDDRDASPASVGVDDGFDVTFDGETTTASPAGAAGSDETGGLASMLAEADSTVDSSSTADDETGAPDSESESPTDVIIEAGADANERPHSERSPAHEADVTTPMGEVTDIPDAEVDQGDVDSDDDDDDDTADERGTDEVDETAVATDEADEDGSSAGAAPEESDADGDGPVADEKSGLFGRFFG